ncbi:MAG TPA: sigma-70 family RNA polymerase sigma factor [Solirubrobacteraceae bacterium]|nr:sigma-70 family RNA polymerase sigma factor [Solirubrobacteraceae bacterium]
MALGGHRQLDVAELYASRATWMRRRLRRATGAPEPLIEDACQSAWIRLLEPGRRVEPGAVLSWLVRTAEREAWRLNRLDGRDLSLEALLDEAGDEAHPQARAESPEHLVVQRARLSEISRLPERQRRLLWLSGLGLSYEEIACVSGCTVRTVERQLHRARRRLASGPGGGAAGAGSTCPPCAATADQGRAGAATADPGPAGAALTPSAGAPASAPAALSGAELP